MSKEKEECSKCKLPKPKNGESPVGKRLCLCGHRIVMGILGTPVLVRDEEEE